MSESDSCSDDVGSSDDSLTKPKKIVLNKKQKRRWLEAAKKVNTKKMTLAQAAKSYNIAKKSLQQFIINTGGGLKKKDSDVFTTDQEHLLTNHLIKCMTLYGITNNKLRSIIYEYANRLPDCTCPEEWEFRKMASISWFRSFMRRHYELKKLCTKRENTFICTMGCHKRSDGKAALKKLEAKILICKVYRYLQREIEYLQSCNDISLLVNVLRRTAEATGVCEQTVTSMLEEEQMTINSLFEGLPQKDNGVIDVDQSSCVNNEESSLSNVFNIEFNSKPVPVTERVIISFNDKNNTDNTSNNTVDKSNDNVQEENKHNDADVTAAHDSDDDNDDMKLQIDEKMEIDTDNLTQCSDLQRMQQDSAPIQSVKIEIIEDESDQADQECPGDDDELDQDSVVIGPFAKKARLRSRSREKELTNNEDINKETNCLNVEYNVQEELVREEDIKKEEQELKTEIEVDAETMYLNVDYNVKEEFVREEDIKEEEQELKTKGAVDAEKLECEEKSTLKEDCTNNDKTLQKDKGKNKSECPSYIYNSYSNLTSQRFQLKANLISRRTGIGEITNSVLNARQEIKFIKWLHRLHKSGFVITENLVINSLINVWNDKNKNTENGLFQPHLYLKDLIKKYPSVGKLTKLRHNPNIKTWPSYVANYLNEKNIINLLKDPFRLYNLEEFGLSMNSNATNLVIRRDYTEESCPVIDLDNLTTVITICANGTVAPPMIVYPEDHKYNLIPIVPSGWGLNSTNTGWTDGNSLSIYIREYFYPWLLGCGTEFPIILFMDGSKTISPSLLSFCEKKGIHLIGFPTCAKEILQPLDLGVFTSLESTWKSLLRNYKRKNNCELTRIDFATRLSVCLDMCATQELILIGFKESRISEIDKEL